MLKCCGEPKRGAWKTTLDQCDYAGLGMCDVTRMPEERLPHYLQSWAPEHGKRSQGGQRKTLDKVILADAKRFTEKPNITLSELQLLATDRIEYRQMITSKRDDTLGAGYSIS